MSPMSGALIITVIGMGLVFIAILALWGLMALMVRVTARYARQEEGEENEERAEEAEPADEAAPEVVDSSSELKRKAAATAVVLALAQEAEQPGPVQMSSYTSGSAWQAVSRGGQLNQRATLFSRKSRGK
ncbi:MAG: OadG family protein [Anaerolineaceae bacterium]|jgi:sodium pump decarboxylase gamma subunit